MIEAYVNLWECPADLRVITTNPTITAKGKAVMGRGCAREARDSIPGIDVKLAQLISEHGNRVMRLCRYDEADLASFPVKHHWREQADLALIRASLQQLIELVEKFSYSRVVMPRPGCGNGGLVWKDVRPLLVATLDNRFTVVDKR